MAMNWIKPFSKFVVEFLGDYWAQSGVAGADYSNVTFDAVLMH